MPRTSSRKNQIKKAIMRKPKYGGPQGGRPQAPKRVGRAKAAGNGINYLSGLRSTYDDPGTHVSEYGPKARKHRNALKNSVKKARREEREADRVTKLV